jgi:hypothetical protein
MMVSLFYALAFAVTVVLLAYSNFNIGQMKRIMNIADISQ